MNKQAKQTAMQQLHEQLLIDDITPNLRATAKQLVMGAGNLDAHIVFIGEAPGKNEDEQGMPFIGASGKFLDEMLASVHLSRDDIYITNIVKYRPPNNRDPSVGEKRAFWLYLVMQLQIINPQVIVTLGRHSMEYFLPHMAIADVHGQPQQVTIGDKQVTIIPLYHPAAALYNGKLRPLLRDDFHRVIDYIK